MSTLTSSAAWQALEKEYENIANTHMKDMFAQDPARFDKFNVKGAGLHLDFSKNRITEETFDLLIKLAEERGVKDAALAMCKGDFVNTTEYRPALHVALRNRANTPIMVDGVDVMPEVNATLEQMKTFTNQVHSGEWTGYTGKKITDIVNIGIGGSFLGPKVTIAGLQPYWIDGIKTHFISNVDGTDVAETCKLLDPETTLFVIASKSFKTQETLFNSIAARDWFLGTGATNADVAKHFVAVSTNIPAVTEFGIDANNAFAMWDWVGGRYSLWSAIGLPIALQIGWDNFEELLEGANEMDEHFKTAPLKENLPVIMGVLSVWYSNFFNAQTHVVLPYDHYLRALPAHLQQLDMESNGKALTQDGEAVDYATGPIIWGGAGTNGQHSFHQLIHQGTHTIPADFFFPLETHNPVGEHHALLYSNCLSQGLAMMKGKSLEEAKQELIDGGMDAAKAESLAPHKVIPGNRPSNTFILDKSTPKTIGAIIALYEHRVWVQGTIWGINSFDQWGVELGKQLGNSIYDKLVASDDCNDLDSSTNYLVNAFRSFKK